MAKSRYSDSGSSASEESKNDRMFHRAACRLYPQLVEFNRAARRLYTLPARPAPPTTPRQERTVSRSDSVQDNVLCNLQLPLFIESIQKVHVVPKKESILIESQTVLVSKDKNMEDAANLYMVRPSVDHLSVRDEEVSENRVLIGKNTVLFERNTQIKKSELLQNLVTETKKEHNRIGTCKVDEVSGPLSIHCAQSTVVNGDIYHKKELISIFLTAEPRSLEDKELIGIMSKRLIREETPEVGSIIKSAEKMMNNGKYILTLERDIRLLVTNEMWTNDNEYTVTEKRCFEFGQSNNGDFSIIERNHQVSKSILDLNPTFHNGSTNMTGPYASSIYHTQQGKAVNKMEQTVAPAKEFPETTGSFPKTSDGLKEETRKTLEEKKSKLVLAASIPLIKTHPKRVSFSVTTANEAPTTTPKRPKVEGNCMENARNNGSVDSVQTCSVPMEVVANINDVPYKLKIKFNIENDSKEMKFASKKIVIDVNTLWQEETNKASPNSNRSI